MNPWGALFVLLGILAIYIGIKGTENRVYAFVFGHSPGKYNNTPFAPSTTGSSDSQSGVPSIPTTSKSATPPAPKGIITRA